MIDHIILTVSSTPSVTWAVSGGTCASAGHGIRFAASHHRRPVPISGRTLETGFGARERMRRAFVRIYGVVTGNSERCRASGRNLSVYRTSIC